MKKFMLCLAAAITISASAYLVAQQAESSAVTAQACSDNSQCE